MQNQNGTGGGSGSGGASSGGNNGSGGNSPGSGGNNPGSGGNNPGSGGNNPGSGGNNSGSGGDNSGSGGNSPGSGGNNPGSGGNNPGSGGNGPGSGGNNPGSGGNGSGGAGGSGSGGATTPANVLVTSSDGNFWKTGAMWTEASSGNANVTVNDMAAQKWEGFGGAFNELGWSYLTSSDMQDQAIKLLFSATDGAHFTWGRIPIGASDYAMSRYTLDDTGTDVMPDSSQSNRPPADTSLSKFSLDRDMQKLIPYIQAAQKVNPDLRFWASPWTPPVWMKQGYLTTDSDKKKNAVKPSYFDGGSMKNDATLLDAYAQYYTKFVTGYKDKGINIEIVSPQNEPGYEQNYPSCAFDGTTYATWIGKYLGPAMQKLNVKIMLGTLSNADSGKDITTAQAAISDTTAKSFLSVVGVQWGVLDKVVGGQTFSGLPIWATEHKCGNYPWITSDGTNGCGETNSPCPKYNGTQAPNDLKYGVESWIYIRNAINKGKVTSYSAWNMVLDKVGLGIDTTRDWRQDALLVADGGKVNATPAYYVFRHLSQYVSPGAMVLSAPTGGDGVAFKNPDGSIVAVVYNSGSANNNFIVQISGKKLQFSMPGAGWATLKYKP